MGLQTNRSGWPVAAEFVVDHLEGIMRDMFECDPRPYTPLVVTLALFIGTANLLGLVPGMRSPTADFSTTAALAVVVFLAVPFYGIRGAWAEGLLASLPGAVTAAIAAGNHHGVLAHFGTGRPLVRKYGE